jgi:hypothetical protein
MKNIPMIWLVAVLVTASGSVFATVRPAAAAEPMTAMDCTQAESMLDSAASSKASTIMTGDVDKDFAALMLLHEKVGKRIDQIEAKCGKDVKMQAMAAKGSDAAQQRMDEFRNLGTSQ